MLSDMYNHNVRKQKIWFDYLVNNSDLKLFSIYPYSKPKKAKIKSISCKKVYSKKVVAVLSNFFKINKYK